MTSSITNRLWPRVARISAVKNVWHRLPRDQMQSVIIIQPLQALTTGIRTILGRLVNLVPWKNKT